MTEHQLEFRKLRLPEDRPVLLLLHEAYDQEYGFIRKPGEYDVLAGYLEKHQEIYHMFALMEGEQPLGYIRAYERMSTSSCDRVLMFDLLYILPHARGQKLGTGMMEHLVAFAQANGNARIDLLVDIDNAPAIRLYQKFGFEGRIRQQMHLFIHPREDLLAYFHEKKERESRS